MRKFAAVLSCFLFICSFLTVAQTVETVETVFTKTTYPFSVKNNQTLYLDRYANPETVGNQKTPCLIFVFGGAFARGSRDVPKYIPYFDYLVENGYTVVSIDYRLGLKEAAEKKGAIEEEQIAKLFINAVDMAVEDLFDATRFVLDHADEWNIDTSHIVANGSSAGAVTVLQAEYAICNNTYHVSEKLPAGFRYAGIISFAGAIFVNQGSLQWPVTPSPIMLLHGDADLQVPYDRLQFGPMGFYGAKTIAGTLQQNNFPYYFYQFEDYGHEIASDPMQNNKEDVLWFLHTLIRDKKPYQIYKDQKEIGRPVVNKNFGFEDYVKGNYDR